MRHPTLPVLALALSFASLDASPAERLEARPLKPATSTPGAPRLVVLPSAETGVTTPNVFTDPRMWGNRFRELTLGAVETGIAIADFDGDGLRDIFSVSKNGPCSLFRQVAPWKFEDVAAKAGVTGVSENQLPSNTGASVVDINQDGRPDLYLCRYELPNLLFINQGDGTFREAAAEYGLAVADASVHAVWGDYDRDGDLDVYLVTNILDFSKSPQGRRDYLFRNNGAGRFEDVTKPAGIWGLTQGHTALWTDLNQDGWPDLYVANDFETADRLYINRGDGTFADMIDDRLPHVTYFSMGADSGDINNDGLVDLFITDMRDRTHREFMAGMEEISRGLWEQERVSRLIPQYMWNAVYVNSGNDRFLEAAHLTGLEATGWTWSARLIDLDNDGLLDAFVTAGMVRNFIDADLVDKQRLAPDLVARAQVWKNSAERREVPLVYHNRGSLEFDDVSAVWGLKEPAVAFGCAVADLDADGDLDLVYSNFNAPPTLVRNDGSTGGRLVLQLQGSGANREGIGAEVTLTTEKGRQVRQLFTERGIAASEPAELHFGLGAAPVVKSLSVRWPSGRIDSYENIAPNQVLTLREGEGPAEKAPARLHQDLRDTAFVQNEGSGLNYTHTLKPFDELTRQRMLPRRLFAQSPALASADVNKDGVPDVFVAGTTGQASRLYLGNKDGTFAPAPSQPWEGEAAAYDAGALFADLNGDGAVDLLVAAGGVETPSGSAVLNDRVYLNDGKGNFQLAADFLPADGESTKALAAGDMDGDGTAEIFVGGRSVPFDFPTIPRSFLYRRVEGRWIDATEQLAPFLRRIGLVTAALWADVDGDKKAELIVATEWGAIRLLHWNGKQLEDQTEARGLAPLQGWWAALQVADVNGDGRPDLVAGNTGLNTKYRASLAKPLYLLYGDFDGNGRNHLVETQFADGKRVPVRGRSKLSYAFPWISEKYPTFAAFGQASVEEIFGPEKLQRVGSLSVTELRSGVFLQLPTGKFEFKPFVREVQMAPIHALATLDYDGDGLLDLVAVGNDFFPEPTTGRFDGAQGWLLRGDGRGGFIPLWPNVSGLMAPYDTRSILVIENPATRRPRLIYSATEKPIQVLERR